MQDRAQEILEFWFNELTPEQHFEKGGAADRIIAQRFIEVYRQLAINVPTGWQANAKGCLAAIIVLDQFPRNLFRGTARAFATDASALALARYAIANHFDRARSVLERAFFYLPFEHSENLEDQERSVELFASLNDDKSLHYAREHQKLIQRFGHFPHRNEALGRASTPEEIVFINTPGSGF